MPAPAEPQSARSATCDVDRGLELRELVASDAARLVERVRCVQRTRSAVARGVKERRAHRSSNELRAAPTERVEDVGPRLGRDVPVTAHRRTSARREPSHAAPATCARVRRNASDDRVAAMARSASRRRELGVRVMVTRRCGAFSLVARAARVELSRPTRAWCSTARRRCRQARTRLVRRPRTLRGRARSPRPLVNGVRVEELDGAQSQPCARKPRACSP